MKVKVMGARFVCGWSEAARRWLPARCGAAVASCQGPMRRGGGFLPYAVWRWLLAGGFGPLVSSDVECIVHI